MPSQPGGGGGGDVPSAVLNHKLLYTLRFFPLNTIECKVQALRVGFVA